MKANEPRATADPGREPIQQQRSGGGRQVTLSPEQMRLRLREALDTTLLSRLINLVGFSNSRKAYVGRVGRSTFRIETRNGFGSHGGALVLYGSLRPLADGTTGSEIRWRFGLHPLLRLVAGFWFLAAAFAGGVNLLRAIFTHHATMGFRAGHLLMAVIGPALMIAAGLAFIRYCLYSERDKKQALTEMLLALTAPERSEASPTG